MGYEKVGFVFEKVLDFLSLLWYVVVLIGGAIFEYAFKLGSRLIYEALCEYSE